MALKWAGACPCSPSSSEEDEAAPSCMDVTWRDVRVSFSPGGVYNAKDM